MSRSETSVRDPALDLLRGAAVLYIVGYYHIQEVWVVRMPGGLAGWLARVALALFCCLSGYLLGGRVRITVWTDVGRFYGRRLARIYPLYFAALLGFAGLGLIDRALFWPAALLLNTLWNWNVLTLWFVSMIFLFYVVTPVFLWRPSLTKTAVWTLVLLVIAGTAHAWSGWIDPRVFPNLVAYALGIAMAQSALCRTLFLQTSTAMRSVSLFALIFLGALLFDTLPNDANPAHMILIVSWFGAALPWLLTSARWLACVVPGSAVSFLATASFVLYLSHRLVYRLGDILWHPSDPLLRNVYYVGVLLPVALFLSNRIQRAYDR